MDIELVIRIPEIEYEHLINKEKFCALGKSKQEWLINKILNYVTEGTPLPEGHGRLIDADALNRKDVNCANVPMNFIDTALTIIEADKEE